MSSRRLSEAGLNHLHDVLAGYVERRDVPGLVALVARGDDVHVEVLGMPAAGGGGTNYPRKQRV